MAAATKTGFFIMRCDGNDNFSRFESDWEPFTSLHGLIRLILLVDWDPIGILGFPGALSQYDRYAAEVYRLVSANGTRYEVIRYLVEVQTERIEMSVNQAVLENVADRIMHIADCFKKSQEQSTK